VKDADTLDLWKVRYCAINHVFAQIPTQKVAIGRSQRFLLESEDFLKSVTATNPLDPIDSLTELNVPLPIDHINIIIVRRPTKLKMS
jgi:hypothetical protein